MLRMSRLNDMARAKLANNKQHSGEIELPGNCIDDVDLAGIQAWHKRRRGHLELKQCRVSIWCIDRRSLDDRRFEDLHFAAVEGEAGAKLWRRSIRLPRIVHFVVEEELLILADDVREVRQKLHAVADEWIVRLAFHGHCLQLRAE